MLFQLFLTAIFSSLSLTQAHPHHDSYSPLVRHPSNPISRDVASINERDSLPGGQQLAIASYIPPATYPETWSRLDGYSGDKLSILIANAESGPGTAVNSDWANVIKNANAAGKIVLGYVRTGYFSQNADKTPTRVGSITLADWTSQIEGDIRSWYKFYPGIGGIFFDEGWNECGTDNLYSDTYKSLSHKVKSQHSGAITVLNPGSPMPQCFENSADTLMTFENNYNVYTTGYVANTWTAIDTRKIWHIIYNVSESEAAAVAALAKQRGAGLIEITDDNLPNPYDNLPSDAYMQKVLNAVAGGVPFDTNI